MGRLSGFVDKVQRATAALILVSSCPQFQAPPFGTNASLVLYANWDG